MTILFHAIKIIVSYYLLCKVKISLQFKLKRKHKSKFDFIHSWTQIARH